MKDVAARISSWVRWHLWVGFERLYIFFDDASETDSVALAKEAARRRAAAQVVAAGELGEDGPGLRQGRPDPPAAQHAVRVGPRQGGWHRLAAALGLRRDVGARHLRDDRQCRGLCQGPLCRPGGGGVRDVSLCARRR
eukprot:4969970-Prymnesium_polylepis.2